MKWNGKVMTDVIHDTIGNRQGGYSSADEWKIYGNLMLKTLEENCMTEDYIGESETNVIAIADDVAPCATANSPREALHRMQLLLNIVEDREVQTAHCSQTRQTTGRRGTSP